MIPVLLYSCETWILNTDLKRQIDVFGNKCLGYCWNDCVSNQRLLHETESRPITSIVCQHQLWLYAHVARYPEADPASQIVSERDNLGWRRARGRPQSLWLGQVNASCWELLGMGKGLSWSDRQSWHQRVGEATCLSACAHNN